MIAYKLLRLRKRGDPGPLFINRGLRMPTGVWLDAEPHPTRGYAFRKGWHACEWPRAPHLSMRGRAWFRVQLDGEILPVRRPASQGGLWFVAERMKIIERVTP